MSSIATVSLLLHILTLNNVTALENGLGLTPMMGVSTWSIFRKDINDTVVRRLADDIVANGLVDAGYDYLLVDDGWTDTPPRDEKGKLVIDTYKFSNLTATIDYVHSLGLKFGLWFGHDLCAPTNDEVMDSSELDYATMDAIFFANLQVDAIKHDNCVDVQNTTEDIKANFDRFERLGMALNATGRPMWYDVALQVNKQRTIPSYDYNYIWSPEPYGRENVKRISNSWWSLPINKYNCWKCCVHHDEYIMENSTLCNDQLASPAWRGLLPMLDIQDMGTPAWKGHLDWGGKGGWNHMDQLGVCVGESWYGPGLTLAEQRAQFALWIILASPMILSLDVGSMDVECQKLIANPRAIAIHQDKLAKPGKRLKNIYMDKKESETNDNMPIAQVWGRPLENKSVAAVFFNRGEIECDISISFQELGFSESRVQTTASIVDVWTGETTSGFTSEITATSVPPHGVHFLIVSLDGNVSLRAE